jgi:hypothetical protein
MPASKGKEDASTRINIYSVPKKSGNNLNKKDMRDIVKMAGQFRPFLLVEY